MPRIVRLAIVFAAAGLLRAAPAAAQFRVDLDPGAPVRLTTAAEPEVRVVATYLRPDGNGTTIVVWPRGAPDGTQASYAIADLASLEVRSGRNRERGALIGAGLATAITGVFGGIDHARGGISSGELAGTVASNALFGGLLGYLLAPRGWRPLPLPRRSASATEAAGTR
ncbi:MAG TPA: hypothetical protein VEX86_19540 [Longimicrobium sp.]|nr:hypothetical protein [Longimicrobium sp.]